MPAFSASDAAALSLALWCAGVFAVAVAVALILSAVAYRCLVLSDADIDVTYNVYTHMRVEDVREEMVQAAENAA